MSDAPATQETEAGSPEIEFVSAIRELSFPDEWYRLTHPTHFWFQWRLAAALSQVRDVGIPTHRSLKALEVGGGTGVLREQLETHTSWIVDMTDVNLEALRLARRGRGRTLYYDVLEERSPFVGAYDVVILFDVIEHIEPTGPFLRSALRHLKEGGHLLVNVPALRTLFSAYDRVAGHVRRYDKRKLTAEFAEADIEIRDLRYWGFALIPLLLARKLLLRGSAHPPATIRAGFQPPGRLIHGVLRALMRLETALWKPPPLGTSLLAAGRRVSAGRLKRGS